MDRARSKEAHPPSEDTIHRCLAAALGAAAVALLLVREPSAAHPGTSPPDQNHPATAAEVTRPQLDAAIAMLTGWLERHAGEPHTQLQANLRLLSLGRAALLPSAAGGHSALVLANLQALAAPGPSAQPASVPPTPPRLADDRADDDRTAEDRAVEDAAPSATLAILLEAGTPLDHELPFPTGPTPLASLLEHALARLDARPDADPWTLDLLSFSLLGGSRERRETLARLAQLGLTRLDREQRQEREQSDEAAANALRAALSKARQSDDSRPRQLQLATSVFRAVAVLAEPSLEAPALRQLNALLERPRRDGAMYRALLEQTRDADARKRIHIDALENLGRLEQALYGAHVAFGRSDRPGPSPRTAASMRRAASDLLEHLDALRQTPGFGAGPTPPPPPELLRALTHALRGLRASRIAT
jgi:hypothetical protein